MIKYENTRSEKFVDDFAIQELLKIGQKGLN
jgi:hypothetical protein